MYITFESVQDGLIEQSAAVTLYTVDKGTGKLQ